MYRILAVNPGATSTKIGLFDDNVSILKKTIEHQGPALKEFSRIIDQFQFRINLITEELENSGIELQTIKAIVGRGGLLKPVASGTYLVNEQMIEDLEKAERGEHASNLGAIIAFTLAKRLNIQAYIVDPVAVDELEPVARISGMPELPRISLSHALNSKAVAKRMAKELNQQYNNLNLIVAHLGTGVTVSCHSKGRMIDVNTAQDEGPFSPDRCGGLPAWSLVKLCYSGKYSEQEMHKKLMGSGGIYAYLGTKDIREVVERASNNDEKAELILNAMIYQVAKEIGALSTIVSGKVDQIILTGGIAYNERITNAITEKVKFIAPVAIMPGEEELESLAQGVLRVINKEEKHCIYQ